MNNLRVLGFKMLMVLLLSVSIYAGMIEFGFSDGLAGAVSAGSAIIVVQVVLTELDFYDRFKQNQSG